MLYRIAIFSKYRDTSTYQYVLHITKHVPLYHIATFIPGVLLLTLSVVQR